MTKTPIGPVALAVIVCASHVIAEGLWRLIDQMFS